MKSIDIHPLKNQQGIALMMALIALVAMSLIAMALMRSVDTGNLVAGNIAFRQSANQFADIAFENAYTALETYRSNNNLNTNIPSGCTTNCVYYNTKQAVDTYDIPTGLTWPAEQSLTGYSGYTYSYIMVRLCSKAYNPGTSDPEDAMNWCYTQPLDEKYRIAYVNGDTDTPLPKPYIYYQVTVRVSGPRNTTTYAQRTFVAG